MRYVLLLAFCVLSGCEFTRELLPNRGDRAPEEAGPPLSAMAPDAATEAADSEDAPVETASGSATPNAALPAPVGVGAGLGTTVAALGDPSEGGMWLKTPLVTSTQPGQVRYQGSVVAVTLRPLDGPAGGGSEISLRAMQALGAPLTELVELIVERT